METQAVWHSKDHITIDQQVDQYVGARVRLRRKLLSQSQTWLGDAIGLTFQQIQKYEKGKSRIGASRLWSLSQALDVPVSYFFDGLDRPDRPERLDRDAGLSIADNAPGYWGAQAENSGQPLGTLTAMETRLCHALRSLTATQQKIFHELVMAFTPAQEGAIQR